MNTTLRLLLDECLQGELAAEIKGWNKVRVEWVCDNPALRNRNVPDHEIMAYAQKRKCILVTVEGHLNERRFPLCTHRGIIVFQATRHHESTKADMFKRFMLSGERSKSNHAVTYLRRDLVLFKRKGIPDETVKL